MCLYSIKVIFEFLKSLDRLLSFCLYFEYTDFPKHRSSNYGHWLCSWTIQKQQLSQVLYGYHLNIPCHLFFLFRCISRVGNLNIYRWCDYSNSHEVKQMFKDLISIIIFPFCNTIFNMKIKVWFYVHVWYKLYCEIKVSLTFFSWWLRRIASSELPEHPRWLKPFIRSQ